MEKSNKAISHRPQRDRIMDAQLVTIKLPSFIKQLKSEKAWKKSDRNSITVFKSGGISTVLIALHKGAEMAKHTSEGIVSVQVLKGELRFKLNEQAVKLRKGYLLKLNGGVPHSLQAKKETIFLLTIAAIAGNNQANHHSNTTLEQDKLNGMSVIRETI